ncbi:unnamed protein product [Hyaloperonospora brassicae]|uniref:ABC-transporter extension domain-containing protein n=1 Tax=Hyaloperonospora brassicae TaxID=162125 RepID=A0AAV0TIU3_HYABA|nr:unnamed protein product [Hyaloperonospora brassicae]
MDGLKESQELLAASNDVSMAMGEPDADLDALLAQQATLQDKIEQLNCWHLSHEVEKAMAALKVLPRDTDVDVLSGGERRQHDRGETYEYEGNYTTWLTQRRNRLNMQRKGDAVRAKQIASEIAWVQEHQGSKKVNKARVKKLQDMESSGFRTSARIDEGQIVVPSGSCLGNKVIKVNNLHKTFNDGRVLFDKLSFEIPPHAIVGIVGGNGM